jgi:hypothetical protein
MKYFISRKISFPLDGYEFVIKFVFVNSRCSRGGSLNVEPYFVCFCFIPQSTVSLGVKG